MFKLIIPKDIEKDMRNFPKEKNILILKKIEELKIGNFTNDKALNGKYKGKFRKRAGDYRIIYLKENNILLITLIRIAHRKEVY
ncbi:type II toxin-antitoxin system RelE family toxin [Aliarcobacter cryaerophilus]|uniref:type II toxin-antitoxin system RelE family toxin n=1 Tax=Aliarcobacter cryaerophilus TaxID=28198 RepID=UPI0021B1B19D|nr:type II toxin-antitoxin system RelE/ParE family toxin [Aliarcobacter cryaerophilus]MCT7512137.1 type II toxin-antitoxin system RelE/ParE family toxin [Aliarcobacter cryaerophilus]